MPEPPRGASREDGFAGREDGFLRRLRAGDRSAIGEFVEAHRERVYRLAFRLTGNHADADDLAQETFLKAIEAIEEFRGEAALASWLHRIAVNLRINRTKSAAHTRRDAREAEALAAPVAAVAESRLLAAERDALLREAVAGLPPRQREVLVLRVYEQWRFAEIAEALGCAEGTAKAHFFQAVGNLRRTIGSARPGFAPPRRLAGKAGS